MTEPRDIPMADIDWRELHQDEQPRLSDGYTAIQFVRPGLYLVKGPGPAKHPVPSGDYHEGIEEGWKAGAAQEQRIWRMAIERYFDGTAVEDVEKYVEELRKGVEGELIRQINEARVTARDKIGDDG